MKSNYDLKVEDFRCGVLKTRLSSSDFYEDIQRDYRKFMPLMFFWSGMGYCRVDQHGKPLKDNNDKFLYITEEEAVIERNRYLNNDNELIECIDKFINSIDNSSHYSIFSKNFHNDPARLTDNRKEFLNALKNGNKEIQIKCCKKDEPLSCVSEEFWEPIAVSLRSGQSLENVWNSYSLFNKLVDPNRSLGSYLRQKLDINCCRPTNNSYCIILMKVLSSQILSLKEKYDLHRKEYFDLKAEVDGYVLDSLYQLVIELGKELDSLNYGLSRVVMSYCIKLINTDVTNSRYRIPVEVLRNSKYAPLVEASYKSRIIAYNKFKKMRRLANRRLFPIRPAMCDSNTKLPIRDVKVHFGISQNGLCRFKQDRSNLIVDIDNIGEVKCMYSSYFGNLKFTEEKEIKPKNNIAKSKIEELIQDNKAIINEYGDVVYDGTIIGKQSNKIIAYSITFQSESRIDKNRKTTNSIKPPSKPITGKVKEVGLQKKNGVFFLTIPYSIEFPKKNRDLTLFFATAAPKKELLDRLSDTIVVSGVDLNIRNPVAICTVKINKNGVGSFHALDYGCGELIRKPFFAAADGPRIQRLIYLNKDCSKLIDAIREYKSAYHNYIFGVEQEFKISDETMSWLLTAKVSKKTYQRIANPNDQMQFYAKMKLERTIERLKKIYLGRNDMPIPIRVPVVDTIRPYIEAKINKIRRLLGRIHKEQRATGYKDISYMIQLLSTSDKYHSLIQSYQRIHLLPNESLPRRVTINTKRQNWRLFVSRKIAACIVAGVSDSDLVFLENLSSNYDSDNDNNSLSRLFCGPTLIKIIKQALNKVGIACLQINKDGTSKTDPLTGMIGYRANKNNLVVKRNDTYVRIDADLAAATNILLKGLSHNICPYKFRIKPSEISPEQKTDDSEVLDNSKRITRFFKEHLRITKPIFIQDTTGIKVVKKATKKDLVLSDAYVYFRCGCFFTYEEHRRQEAEINENECKDGKYALLPMTDVTPDGIRIYENFRVYARSQNVKS